jgi:hypothetical protein
MDVDATDGGLSAVAPDPDPEAATAPPVTGHAVRFDIVPARSRGGVVRSDVVQPLLVAAATSIAVGLAWWQLESMLGRATDPAEVTIAGDAAFALPALVAGLLTAGWLVARPGTRPLVRLVVAVGGAVLGSLGAWALGHGLGVAPLRALGVLLVWPIAVSLVVMIASLVATITAPE